MLVDADILYHDNHLLAVCKQGGMICQPSNEHPHSLEDEAKAWVKMACHKPGAVFLHVVHRLDLPVSGIVMMAKTDKALSRMMQAIREKQTKKRYLAVVEGVMTQDEMHLQHWLVHEQFCARVVKEGTKEAKQARLICRVLERREANSLVEIELETGRYHQIRAQLSAIGFPIVGDGRYGARTMFAPQQIALHHWKFDFIHPVKKEPIGLCALPDMNLKPWQNWQCLEREKKSLEKIS